MLNQCQMRSCYCPRAQSCCEVHTSVILYLQDKWPDPTRTRIGLEQDFVFHRQRVVTITHLCASTQVCKCTKIMTLNHVFKYEIMAQSHNVSVFIQVFPINKQSLMYTRFSTLNLNRQSIFLLKQSAWINRHHILNFLDS